MATQWPDWLRQLAVDGKSGQSLPSIVRGDPYTLDIVSEYDFSADAFRGQLRLGPDADGSALANFTVTPGAYVDGQMNIRFALVAGDTATLPEDADADGLTEIVWEFERDKGAVGTWVRWAAGTLKVSGKVDA